MADKAGIRQQKPKNEIKLGNGPFVFTTDAFTSRGKISIINKGKDWAQIPTLSVSGFEIKTIEGERLEQIYLNAHVAPYQTQLIPVLIRLHPSTPPGEFIGKVHYERQSEEMIIFVPEIHEIEITPTRFTLCGQPGDTLQVEILVKNLGNTGCQLPQITYLAIADGNNYEISALAALKEVGDQGYDVVRDFFIKTISELQVDPININILQPKEIKSGEYDRAKLELTLPGNVQSNRTYQGRATLFKTKLRFDLQIV